MSATSAAACAAALSNRRSVARSSSSVENSHPSNHHLHRGHSAPERYNHPVIGLYELQKQRDWNHFVRFLRKRNDRRFNLAVCGGADVIEFLNQTKVHATSCPNSGQSQPPPPPCYCPFPGNADALVLRLRVAFEENGGSPAKNPFRSRAVWVYLEESRGSEAKI